MKLMCVVVVLLYCSNVSYTCPSDCSCSGNGVDCEYANLIAIPSGISNTTEEL